MTGLPNPAHDDGPPGGSQAPESAQSFGRRMPENESFLQQHGMTVAAGAGAVGVLVLLAVFVVPWDDTPPPRVVPELTIVNIIPPPPPPPPPPEETPPPPEEPEPEMIEQPQIEEPMEKPDEVVEEPEEVDSSDEPPPGPLGLDATAEGPGDLFNLAGKPGGRGLTDGSGRRGTRWGWYASIITQQVESALRDNPKTRHLVGQVQVRLWADGAGRVSRVQLVSGSGSPEIDSLISGTVLGGLTLREPPPPDMPMPIVTRITGRKST